LHANLDVAKSVPGQDKTDEDATEGCHLLAKTDCEEAHEECHSLVRRAVEKGDAGNLLWCEDGDDASDEDDEEEEEDVFLPVNPRKRSVGLGKDSGAKKPRSCDGAKESLTQPENNLLTELLTQPGTEVLTQPSMWWMRS
jgi:hypothetical protein